MDGEIFQGINDKILHSHRQSMVSKRHRNATKMFQYLMAGRSIKFACNSKRKDRGTQANKFMVVFGQDYKYFGCLF